MQKKKKEKEIYIIDKLARNRVAPWHRSAPKSCRFGKCIDCIESLVFGWEAFHSSRIFVCVIYSPDRIPGRIWCTLLTPLLS